MGRSEQFACTAPREVCCGNPRRCTGARIVTHPDMPKDAIAVVSAGDTTLIRNVDTGSYLDRLGYGDERRRDKPRVRLS